MVKQKTGLWGGRLPDGEASFNVLYGAYVRSAEKRGYEWALNKEEFRTLTSNSCHYCGEPPSSVSDVRRNTGVYVYNGLDRVDNAKGYAIGNVVPCCTTCNKMKGKFSTKEFLDHIHKIINYGEFPDINNKSDNRVSGY